MKSPLDPSQESKISDNELVTFKLRLQSAFLAPQEDFQALGLVLGVERGKKSSTYFPSQ